MCLEKEAGLHVVGEAGDGETALARIEELRPDVALLDIDMRGGTDAVSRAVCATGARPQRSFFSLCTRMSCI